MKANYDDSIKISDEDYDSGEEWSQNQRPIPSPTEPNFPDGTYIVELKASQENQINHVIMSAVNITTKPSIYEFHGKFNLNFN